MDTSYYTLIKETRELKQKNCRLKVASGRTTVIRSKTASSELLQYSHLISSHLICGGLEDLLAKKKKSAVVAS
jgi:hypothetical protein